MRGTARGAAVAVLAGVAVVAALAGCAPAVHPHPSAAPVRTPPTATATTTPTAAPTAAALGPMPANALFRITATVTETGGATADLVQTVFAPTAPTASDTALLNAQCNLSGQPTWQSTVGNAQYVTTTITATLRPGSPAWDPNDQVAAYFGGYVSAFTGDYLVAQAQCAPGYIGIPGTIHGVTPVQASDPATGQYGWASEFGEYGFDGSGNDPGAGDESGTGVVSNCHIEESDAAKATSGVIEGWLTQAYDQQSGCSYQGAGPA